MTLPEIVLPKIALPFDIPVLLHPLVVHFLVAIPVVILLLELMNLIMKKKAVGGVSFFLIILTVLAAIGAYFTGLADGKEAFPALGEAAKTALSEHKLLGTYLLLGSAVLLFLKLLAMTGNKILKILYIIALIGFVVVIFKQGKEGGELVYNHGLNVQAVKTLDDKIFDLEEALEEAKIPVPAPVQIPVVQEKIEVKAKAVVEKVAEELPTPEVVEPVVVEPTDTQPVETKPLESTGIETMETVPTPVSEKRVEDVEEKVVVIPSAVETLPTE